MDIYFLPVRPKKVNQTDLRYQIKDDEIYGPNSKLKYNGRIINRRNPLPSELFTFYHLQVLDLSSKGAETELSLLESLPAELFRLRNLRVLNIDNHNLRKIPNEISALNKLEILTLTRNKLFKLPSSFSNLISLKFLHISSNCFEQFPEVICKLKFLTFLDISSNRLRSIPSEINHLTALETLILFDNKLEQIPSSLCDFDKLRTLYLAFNNIKRLPNRLFCLKNLDWNRNGPLGVNCLTGNPIEFPPIDKIVSRDEIYKFLRENTADCILCEEDEEYNNDYVPANSVDTSLNHEIRIPNALVGEDLDEEV